MVSFGTQLTIFGEDIGVASSKYWLFLDDDWQFDRETQIDVMLLTVERVAALQAPASASHIAGQVDDMTLEIRAALSMIRISLQVIDGNLLEDGTARMTDQTPNMIQLSYDLDRFCE